MYILSMFSNIFWVHEIRIVCMESRIRGVRFVRSLYSVQFIFRRNMLFQAVVISKYYDVTMNFTKQQTQPNKKFASSHAIQ